MNYNIRVILRTISVVLLFEGVAMLFSVFCAVYYHEKNAASALFLTSLFCICIGLGVYKNLPYYTLKIKLRESFFTAFLCWFIVSLVGTLPFLLSGNGYSFADCLFESVSGWTTTGAWAIDLNTMPRSLILWKATTNWLGGMGLLLLTISLFPVLGAEGLKMASAEVPGPRFEKIAARISDTAKIIYIIYISMTVIEFLLLLPSGLTPFESLINTMSTISTAGVFNLNNDVILNFSPYVKTIFTIFSIAGSVNFFMYFYLFQRKWKRAFGNIEILTYLGLLAGASVVIALSLYFGGYYSSILGALGDAFAQAVQPQGVGGTAAQSVLHHKVHAAQGIHIIADNVSLDHIPEVLFHPFHGQHPLQEFIVLGVPGINADVAGVALVTAAAVGQCIQIDQCHLISPPECETPVSPRLWGSASATDRSRPSHESGRRRRRLPEDR